MANRINLLTLLMLALVLASSCGKWRNNRETLTSENHTLAEASYNFIFHHALLATTPAGELLVDSCFMLTRSGDTLTIDFGNEGCKGIYGTPANGKVIAVLSDSFHIAGSFMTITTEDFYVNGFLVEGAITITNMGLDNSGKQQYHMKVENGSVSGRDVAEEIAISWECEYHFVLTEKNLIALAFDDLYNITGEAAGINNEGRSYMATISEALSKYTDCRYVGAGRTKISPDGLEERDLNYGTCSPASCCDNVAVEEAKWPDRTVRMN